MDPRRWEEVQAAFDELVQLEAPSRATRLAALGSTDPELRAAVESLLAADVDADRRLAPLEAGFLSQAGAPPDPLGLAGTAVSHFHVLEPLGAGGMGVVYRAQDTRLGRSVALKFLLPAYSLDTSAKARFLREAHSAAALDHPNLCSIHEVGASEDGRLFLAMTLYPGETLKARLARDGPLPVGEAVEIARQVAEGLASAHAAGIVHRDLKPGNVMLLPDGTVKILDFGLAKARDQSLSESGARFGTVSYMAPEQIRGEAVDGRADLWALGVVLYEMLTGRKPFGGEEDVAVAHAILHDEPVPPSPPRGGASPTVEDRVLRASQTEQLSVLITRCLAKHAADRPQSAAEIVHVFKAATTPGGHAPGYVAAPARARSRRRWLPFAVAGPAAVALVALGFWWQSRRGVTTDERLVAVVPFRVAGADPSLHYLREGMLDLLAAKLTGSTRVADPRSVLAAWRAAGGSESNDIDRAAATRLAAKLGARDVLLGDVTGGAGTVVLRATLVPVNGGGLREATIEGRQDSIPALVDRLAVQLLALRAGEDVGGLGDLAATPFSAIREYLEGQRLARRGQYKSAYDRYRAATRADSNFGAAWFGALDMTWWLSGWANDTVSRALVRLRDRLTPATRAMVDARIGPRYPVLPSLAERRQLAERATQVARDNPYTWQYLGDVLFHWGAAAGVENVGQRAIAAFERALALDSSFHTAIEHLPWLYYELGDTVSMRRWLEASLANDSTGLNANLYLADVVLRDARRGARWRAAIRDKLDALEGFVFVAEDLALPLRPVDSAMTAFTSRAVTDGERLWSTWRQVGLAHIRGQPNRAAKLLRAMPGILRDDWPTHIFVLESVFADGDSSLAETARRTLDASLATDCERPYICSWFTAAVYDMMRGRPQTARLVLNRLRSGSHTACWPEAPSMCAGFALILEALLAAEGSRPDARARLVQLDSMLRAAPVIIGPLLQVGNLVAARLWERSGDANRALSAVRRRVRFLGVPEFYATYLREEGRLAAATGDREGAVRAYRRYLTLREDAEPSLQQQVASVRGELARLEHGRAVR